MTTMIDTLRTARASQTGVVLDAKTLALLLAEIDGLAVVKDAPVAVAAPATVPALATEPAPLLECWINVYSDGNFGAKWETAELAIEHAIDDAIRTAVHMREVTK